MAETVKKTTVKRLPVLALRGMMIFPSMVLHFDAGRPKSVAAVEKAMLANQTILLVAQKDIEVDDPCRSDLYDIGTIAKIKQVLNLPGDNIRVLAEGVQRAQISGFTDDGKCLMASVRPVKEENPEKTAELDALISAAKGFFHSYCEKSQRVSQETAQTVEELEHPGQLADTIASNVLTRLEDKQAILETLDPAQRLECLSVILERETELADLEKKVQLRVKQQVEKGQKEYYLREQIRAIQAELGDGEDNEAESLRERLKNTPVNEEAQAKVSKEIDRLSHMAPGMPEIAISQSYIEWILDLPWGKYTQDQLDLKHARRILDKDHYGLDKVKERIVEYLAVLQMKKDMKGPVLCFVGPPGVGKTSIVRAIAECTGRKFVQMSLGGVRDEAEIRGHRRTYIGAIPGRIISGIKQAGTMNPVFLFDEIDKTGNDFRGDPASALLEVLDAEQNNAFRDHYLDIPFDLSKVMFITTANTVDTIPPALLDRMEIIEVPSYTESEKKTIAKKHLLPKQIQEHGMKPRSVRMTDAVLKSLIEGYTREAGVRELERVLAHVVRKAAVDVLDTGAETISVTAEKLKNYLGTVRYTREPLEGESYVGLVNGLAFTEVGGELLTIECTVMQGTGVLQLTGKLGDVMQESAKAALSWVRTHASEWGIAADFFKQNDIHIHVPEGAVPKDGPSAGVTLTTAIVSAITAIPARRDLAMTGEVTLRGRVLPIGGLKEKLMAAYRAGCTLVLIPQENQKDLEDVPKEILSALMIQPVQDVSEVLKAALIRELPTASQPKDCEKASDTADRKPTLPHVTQSAPANTCRGY